MINNYPIAKPCGHNMLKYCSSGMSHDTIQSALIVVAFICFKCKSSSNHCIFKSIFVSWQFKENSTKDITAGVGSDWFKREKPPIKSNPWMRGAAVVPIKKQYNKDFIWFKWTFTCKSLQTYTIAKKGML